MCPTDVTSQETLVVLSINDVYDMHPNLHGQGGMAQLSTLLQKERQNLPLNATLLVTLNGDFLSGSRIAERCKGEHMIQIINYLRVDYVVLGNHEFDFGLDILLQRIAESSCKWLGANVRCKTQNNALLKNVAAYDVITLKNSNVRIGIFGICTPSTPHISYPGDDVVFQDIVSSSRECVQELQTKHHVDFIIALTHVSMQEDKQLAQTVPGIDFILGGHDHEPFTLYENSTLIHKSGQNAHWLARFDFQFLPSQDEVHVIPQWKMIANYKQRADPKCTAIIAKYEDEDEESNTILAILEKPLVTITKEVRTKECNMGNLIADALRYELSADVGLINGGFIRGDREYPAKTNLTKSVFDHEMPFPSPAVLVKIKLSDFRQALLQHFALYPQPSAAFPHVSGLHVTLTITSVPYHIDLQIKNLSDGNASDPEIHVATSAFIAMGGDKCTHWKNGTILKEVKSTAALVMEYVSRKRILSYEKTEDRIQILNSV